MGRGRSPSYATPVLATIAGVPQILSVDEGYVTAHDSVDGKILWEHEWPSESDSRAATSQPVPVGNDRIFPFQGLRAGGGALRH
jgi:outer membrane protein assembly factor BamB